MTKNEIMVLIAFMLAIVLIALIPHYINKKNWKVIKHKYITKARTEINHDYHRQNVILWLQSAKAEEIYVHQPKSFNHLYYEEVDKIGDEIILKLTKKYINEYKSRNTKDIKAV